MVNRPDFSAKFSFDNIDGKTFISQTYYTPAEKTHSCDRLWANLGVWLARVFYSLSHKYENSETLTQHVIQHLNSATTKGKVKKAEYLVNLLVTSVKDQTKASKLKNDFAAAKAAYIQKRGSKQDVEQKEAKPDEKSSKDQAQDGATDHGSKQTNSDQSLSQIDQKFVPDQSKDQALDGVTDQKLDSDQDESQVQGGATDSNSNQPTTTQSSPNALFWDDAFRNMAQAPVQASSAPIDWDNRIQNLYDDSLLKTGCILEWDFQTINPDQICAFAEKLKGNDANLELFFTKVMDKFSAFNPDQAYRFWESIKALPVVKQYYPKLNAAQLERIVKTCFDTCGVVLDLPAEISGRQLYELFQRVQNSDKALANTIKYYTICQRSNGDLSSQEWHSLFVYRFDHHEIAEAFIDSNLTKEQLIGFSSALVELGQDDAEIKLALSRKKPSDVLMQLLKELAEKPSKFPEAKRIYDLLTQAAPAPAPVSAPAPISTSAVNWDDWIRDLPADKTQQKALLEQTDLQGMSWDQIVSLFEKLKDDADNCDLCFTKVESKLVGLNPDQAYKLWTLIKEMTVSQKFCPKLSIAQAEPIARAGLYPQQGPFIEALHEMTAKQLHGIFTGAVHRSNDEIFAKDVQNYLIGCGWGKLSKHEWHLLFTYRRDLKALSQDFVNTNSLKNKWLAFLYAP